MEGPAYGPLELISAIFSLLSFLFWMAVIAVIVLFLIKIFSVNRYAEESAIEHWSAVLPGQLLSVMKRYTFANGNKIRAFASATHSAAVEAAEQIMDEANADKSRLNRKTSGKLGPL